MKFKEWKNGLDHFFDRINFGDSYLDSKAIKFMDEGFRLESLEKVVFDYIIENGVKKHQTLRDHFYDEEILLRYIFSKAEMNYSKNDYFALIESTFNSIQFEYDRLNQSSDCHVCDNSPCSCRATFLE